MSETKFTPGPWEANTGDHAYPTVSAQDRVIVTIWQCPQQAANARLVSAAPDLYEALREIVEGDDRPSDLTMAALRRAVAALAKAEGRT